MTISGTDSPKVRIRGELHSADASTAAALKLYEDGSLVERVLAASERLVIESVTLVVATAADAFLFCGGDSTVGAGEYLVRGAFANNGGVNAATIHFVGGKGHLVYLKSATATIADAEIYGFIMD